MHFRPAAIGLFAIQILLSRAVKHKAHKRWIYKDLIPHLESTNDGHVKELESFGNYVARQLGLKEGNTWCWLSKLANDYLRGNRSDSNESREAFFACLNGLFSVDEIDSLYSELVKELEVCMLSYFAFHWEHYSDIIYQVLDSNSDSKKRLRAAILSATRKQRFEKVSKTLRIKNVFSTFVELLKAIGKYSPHSLENNETDPVNATERPPVLLLVGGGMGAGKSSVIRDTLKDTGENAVVVEADAFKESDLVYKALTSNGFQDMLEAAEFVHKSSTDAASSLLVSVLNEGQDVIFDGTMSWEPFVKQTIAMVRDIHRRRYRMGPGYQVDSDGHVHEKYWEPVEDYNLAPQTEGLKECTKEIPGQEEATSSTESLLECRESRKPYRIELIGVICDAPIAVFRGIRRALCTGRAVRIRDQLLSHKMFADAFCSYSELVDHARLYSTNNIFDEAELIETCKSNGKLQISPKGVNSLRNLSLLNPNAQSVCDLYTPHRARREPDKYWKDLVLSSDRFSRQKYLQNEMQRAEYLLSEQMENLQ